ncbi:DUF29 domain-containing protein [Leptolyngbya sp. CCNP1308]|uniref:DUF29 domain-containing protein n=1 Tax=Leptolyngbya sp. CCNP1308 TaxID=3110255 RepID=UPI002B1EE6FA|nr:DUF29 domain-containing protein [Leptolyngbya sp. CCNP1308]MEA5447049.1 DUF29 domain-containing protein [Leptolyngbya sp. CCNP1308]
MSKIDSTPTGQTAAVGNLYAEDFYAWTQAQAELLRHGAWSQLDLPNLIDEIESLGKQQRQELRNCLSVLIGHLLKWQHQPQNRSRIWLATLRIQRLDIVDLLDDNPSLKPYLAEAVGKAYLKGIELASGETNLPSRTFPSQCSYSLAELLDASFFPGEPSDLIA